MFKAVSQISLSAVILSAILAGCSLPDSSQLKFEDRTTGTQDKESVVDFEMVKSQILSKESPGQCLKCHGTGSPNGEFETYAQVIDKAAGLVVAGNLEKSELFQRLKNNGGDMPVRLPQIPDDQVTLMRRWIQTGAKEKAGSVDEMPQPTATPIATATPDPLPDPLPTASPEPSPEPSVTPEPTASPEPTAAPTASPEPPPTTLPPSVTFADIDAKILAPKCVMCHDAKNNAGGIALDSYDALINNSMSIIPGNSAKSGIYIAIDQNFMPPKRAVQRGQVQAVTAEEKEMLRVWIDAGAQK